ncbi:hypothetical protein T484DRAFT_1808397, partial [Baffinella frigidus]
VGALRADLDREAAALSDAQMQAELDARSAVKGALGDMQLQMQTELDARSAVKGALKDMQLQVAALREMVERGGGGGGGGASAAQDSRDTSQDSRDTSQDDAIQKIKLDVADLKAATDKLFDAGEEDRLSAEKATLEAKLQLNRQKEDAEHAAENAADALRVEFVDLMRDVDDAASSFFAQATARADKTDERVEGVREDLEGRVRDAESKAAEATIQVGRIADKLHGESVARIAVIQNGLDKVDSELIKCNSEVQGCRRAIKDTAAEMEGRVKGAEDRVQTVREVLGDEIKAAQALFGEQMLEQKARCSEPSVLGDEIKAAQALFGEQMLEQKARMGRLDTKFTNDARKIIAAMKSHGEALDRLRKDTDDRVAQVVAQEEEHVRRIWVEVGALRRGNAERIGEMEDKLNNEQLARDDERLARDVDVHTLREAQHESAQKADQAAQELGDAIKQEGHARAMEGVAAVARAREEAIEARRYRQEFVDRLEMHRTEFVDLDDKAKASAAADREEVAKGLAVKDLAVEALHERMGANEEYARM